jgi:hypothetical protein
LLTEALQLEPREARFTGENDRLFKEAQGSRRVFATSGFFSLGIKPDYIQTFRTEFFRSFIFNPMEGPLRFKKKL